MSLFLWCSVSLIDIINIWILSLLQLDIDDLYHLGLCQLHYFRLCSKLHILFMYDCCKTHQLPITRLERTMFNYDL